MNTRPVDLRHFTDLHFLIGRALWQSQAFEDTLAKYIVLILRLPPSRAEDEALRILRQLESMTLGTLVRELRQGNSQLAVSEFERRVNSFVAERNWLAHRSWREHHADVFQPDRMPALMGRINALVREGEALQAYFGQLVTAWTIQQGHTLEEIERRTQQELRDRGVAD